MYESESGKLSIAVVGDMLLTRPLSIYGEERFVQVQQILSGADAAFGNLESSVHRYLDGSHAQHVGGGGTYMTTEPHLLNDLKWMGINLVACGSSHADDYGWGGTLDTIAYLDSAGIAHAGSGRHLAEARAPAYLDTPRGRIALVAATAHFNAAARAGAQRTDTPGHPGVNGIRHRETFTVDQATLDALRRIGRDIGVEAAKARRRFQGESMSEDSEETYTFLGHTFTLGQEFAIRSETNRSDLEDTLRQVRAARAMADRVVVSLHCHEQGGPTLLTAQRRSEVEDLADFAVEFGRRAIDAGADIFVAHGPQIPLAVELYKGKPLFHGMGTFIFQLETVKFLPQEAYDRYGLDERATPSDFVDARYARDTRGHPADPAQWEQICAVCDFAGDTLREVRLYPIELGFGRPRSQRGRPMLAEAAAGQRILRRVATLSKKYGTEVVYRGGIGVIDGR